MHALICEPASHVRRCTSVSVSLNSHFLGIAVSFYIWAMACEMEPFLISLVLDDSQKRVSLQIV